MKNFFEFYSSIALAWNLLPMFSLKGKYVIYSNFKGGIIII
jgi:hypothetical protein